MDVSQPATGAGAAATKDGVKLSSPRPVIPGLCGIGIYQGSNNGALTAASATPSGPHGENSDWERLSPPAKKKQTAKPAAHDEI